jgi:hypothetical protein
VEDREHLTVRLIPEPQHAKTNPDGSTAFQVREDGRFTLTPAPSHIGSDTFVYAFSDGVTGDIATVTVEVYNTGPEASGATFRALHDLTLSGLVPGSEVGGETVTALLASRPSHGALTFDSDHTFTYTPNTHYVGPDSFTYTWSDGLTTGNTATVTIDVYNNAPYAYDASFSVLHDRELTGSVYGYDPDGDTITAQLISGPSNGTLTFHPDGTFTYIPNTHYVGPDSFTYTWSDGLTTGNTATVTIDVYNNAPVAEDDTFVIPRNGQLSLGPSGILENDLDSDGDPLRVSSVIDFQWESATPLASGEYQFTTEVNPDGSLLVVPPADWSGMIRLLYAVSDGVEESYAWVTVYVGDEPILRTDYYVVPEDGILDIVSPSEGVLANDEDRLGRTWEARLVPESAPAPEIGEVTLRADGTFTFIAGPEWTCCSDTHFAYTVAPAVAIVVVAIVVLVGQGCRTAPAPPAAPAPLIDWGRLNLQES